MKSDLKSTSRGGARPGAGRKALGIQKVTISIYLLPEERDRLDQICANTGKSRSDIIRGLMNKDL